MSDASLKPSSVDCSPLTLKNIPSCGLTLLQGPLNSFDYALVICDSKQSVKILTHKAILIAHSEKLANLIYGENYFDLEIKVKDGYLGAMLELIQYMYLKDPTLIHHGNKTLEMAALLHMSHDHFLIQTNRLSRLNIPPMCNLHVTYNLYTIAKQGGGGKGMNDVDNNINNNNDKKEEKEKEKPFIQHIQEFETWIMARDFVKCLGFKNAKIHNDEVKAPGTHHSSEIKSNGDSGKQSIKNDDTNSENFKSKEKIVIQQDVKKSNDGINMITTSDEIDEFKASDKKTVSKIMNQDDEVAKSKSGSQKSEQLEQEILSSRKTSIDTSNTAVSDHESPKKRHKKEPSKKKKRNRKRKNW